MKPLVWEMSYTLHSDSLCGFYKQEQRTELLGELKSLAARALEEKMISQAQLEKCQKETDILIQQMLKQVADHHVSYKGLQSYLKQSLSFSLYFP